MSTALTTGTLSPRQREIGAAWLRYQARQAALIEGLGTALDQLDEQYRLSGRAGRMPIPEFQAYCDQLHVILERYHATDEAAWEECHAVEASLTHPRTTL